MKIKELYDKNEKVTLESYLSKCGVTDINGFLTLSNAYDYLYDVFNYNNMLKGCEIFYKHYENNSKVYIICDSDFDGLGSTYIIYDYMKRINNDWDIEILFHEEKKRGLQDQKILDKVLSEPRELVIIPDAGTNDLEQANKLKGISDLIVLDHHDFETPIEYGVLINNQDVNSNVSRNGSGTMVAKDFVYALNTEFDKMTTRYTDIVALSLISDSMPMNDCLNRIYYCYGLSSLDLVDNEFIKELILKFIGDKAYTQRDISFKIVPKFNAVIRTKDESLKRSIIDALCGENIEETIKKCEQAHQTQINTVDKVLSNNKDYLEELSDNEIIVADIQDMPSSYSGLVAGKIMNMYHRPTLCGKIKDGEFIGSARSPIELRELLANDSLMDFALGHGCSFGVKLKESNIQPLVDKYNLNKLDYEPFKGVLKSLPINSISNDYYDLFGANWDDIWGHMIEKPIWHITDIKYHPSDIQILGKWNRKTLKLKINGVDILFFNSTNKIKEDLGLGYIQDGIFITEPMNDEYSLEIIGYLGTNEFRNKITNQIIVDDFESKKIKKKTIEEIFKKH